MVESTFGRLKRELVHHERYATRAEARASLFESSKCLTTASAGTRRWGTSPWPSTSGRTSRTARNSDPIFLGEVQLRHSTSRHATLCRGAVNCRRGDTPARRNLPSASVGGTTNAVPQGFRVGCSNRAQYSSDRRAQPLELAARSQSLPSSNGLPQFVRRSICPQMSDALAHAIRAGSCGPSRRP